MQTVDKFLPLLDREASSALTWMSFKEKVIGLWHWDTLSESVFLRAFILFNNLTSCSYESFFFHFYTFSAVGKHTLVEIKLGLFERGHLQRAFE